MRDVFSQRRQAFRSRCLKYLRYVFNDHFVLFLMVFIGFLAIQYSQLLRQLPSNRLPIYLALILLSLALLPFGRVATYLEEPDALFLLVQEEAVLSFVKGQIKRAYLLSSVLQTGTFLLLLPLFLALGLPLWGFILYCLALLLFKWFLFQHKGRRFFREGHLDWQYAIRAEQRRRQGILRFFALFTNVKGISNSVKRRPYLDFLTRLLPQRHDQTWQNLYLRSYLRNGDLFPLTLRLLLLSLLTIGFVSQPLIAAAFALFFNYLLLFQLTALAAAFDYQYLTRLFPTDPKEKARGARQIITAIGWAVLAAESLAALLIVPDKTAVLALCAATVLLYLFYLPFKLKGLLDENQ